MDSTRNYIALYKIFAYFVQSTEIFNSSFIRNKIFLYIYRSTLLKVKLATGNEKGKESFIQKTCRDSIVNLKPK